MKNIEFRVWDKANKDFLQKEEEFLWNIIQPFSEQDIVKRYEIQQFTGLCDKNGVKIFEGDIVKGMAYDTSHSVYYLKGEVEFDDGEYIVVTNNGKWPVAALVVFERDSLEVVGNIYETKG